VFQSPSFSFGEQRYRMELTDFRLFNIQSMPQADGSIEQKNFGPSILYKIRDEAGQAREYETYMAPVQLPPDAANDTGERRWYFLSGMRAQVSEPFRFVHIPADSKRSLDTFMKLNALLHDEARMGTLAREGLSDAIAAGAAGQADPEVVARSMLSLLDSFLAGGFDGLGRLVESRLPESERQAAFEAYGNVLQMLLARAYAEVMREQGVQELGAMDVAFLDDATSAINALALYGSPVYVELKGFRQIQSSGLQITRSPGMFVVYLGSVLLTLGVFLMFYVPQQRVWLLLRPSADPSATEVLLAGQSNRRHMDFERELEQWGQRLQTLTTRAG